MEQYAADVLAADREAQLDAVKQQAVATQGKAGDGVAGTGLVDGEAPVGAAAAGEESLGKRDFTGEIDHGSPVVLFGFHPAQRPVGQQGSELGGAGQEHPAAYAMIGRVLHQQAPEAGLGEEELVGQPHINCIINASFGVERVVAAVVGQAAR